MAKKTSKDFYRHSYTRQVFAIMRRWDGTIVGSCGPLAEDDFDFTDSELRARNLASCEYTPDKNDWLNDASDKLILI